MNDLLQSLSSEWAIRALITSILVGCTCGVIGCFIVLRNMSLIGDALSHSILPGIYIAFLLVGYSTIGFFMGSVVAGIVTALTITWIQQNIKTKNDAAIGIVFTAMFSIGVMGISRLNNTQGNHLDLKDFLFGNVLGISNEDIILSAIVMVYTVLSIIIFYRYFFITTFQPLIGETMGISTKAVHYFLMLMLSFAVVAALRSVGVILVVAMLITPASTALLLSYKLKKIIVLSAILGILAAIIGLIVAILFDTTPGPAMVLVSTFLFFIVALFSPLKGLVPNWINQRKEARKIIQEDIIKYLNKNNNTYDTASLAAAINVNQDQLKSNINALIKDEFLTQNGLLSMKGKHRADELVRAHRLWETYQVNDMGMTNDQIHDDAERLEHHLSEEEVDEIDSGLGFPERDPHGSLIPKRNKINDKALFHLKVKSKGIISAKQDNDSIESELWELGLLPNTAFIVSEIDDKCISINIKGKLVKINASLAKEIHVD
jgi:ABC-type Mn2+/Zn2+ transport system permease subunit/Mn-dependent DtxR family transcriptional regulator